MLSAYRYTSRPWRLQLSIDRHRPRVEVSNRTLVAIRARQATLLCYLTAQVTGAPIPSLAVRLPASLRVSQVRVPTDADWYVDRDDKGQRLTVELKQPSDGELKLAVSGSFARDSSQTEFVVPGVTIAEVQSQQGQLAIVMDDDLEAVVINDGGADSIDPQMLDRVLRPDDTQPIEYAFQYESPPDELRLRLSPAPSRLNGAVTTVVSVREGAVAYIAQLHYEVRQAGRTHFRLATPEWLGDDIELRGKRIRQIRSQLSDGIRTWDIELQQPVRGAYHLHLIQTLPLANDGTVPVAIIRPLDVERSRSHVVLENVTADEVTATTISGAAPISIASIPEGLSETVRRQAVAAYRITDEDAVLVWQRRVREQETGLRASINLADLTTVIHADGRYHARAAYNIRNLTLQFLEVRLPPESEVWSVHVSGQPVRPATRQRQGEPVTLLPLQKTSAGDFSSKVVVIYSGRLKDPLNQWTQIKPIAPEILSDVPVSRTLWTLFLPKDYRVSLVESESNLELVEAAYQQQERRLSFLDELREIVQVASKSGKSAVRSKARDNLKQIGSALQSYSHDRNEIETRNAADVQQQAQQIEVEIGRIEDQETASTGMGNDPDTYFERGPSMEVGGDVNRGIEKFLDPEAIGRGEALEKDASKPNVTGVGGRVVARRGKLREQAAKQLAELQTTIGHETADEQEDAPQAPSTSADSDEMSLAAGLLPSGGEREEETVQFDTQDTPLVMAGTGQLSLDLDLTPVGTAYHFRKLHGEPRLVLHARHEDLTRWLFAIVWAGLCLAFAVAAIQLLKRPDASKIVCRFWPWLATVGGVIWLFLLPVGFIGFLVLVTSLCVQVTRMQKRKATVMRH
jgi:hypothetical protein